MSIAVGGGRDCRREEREGGREAFDGAGRGSRRGKGGREVAIQQ